MLPPVRGACRQLQTAAIALGALLTAALPAAAAAAAADGSLVGVWRNPKNSVHVDIQPCGAGVCGHVVWASQKAQADVRHGSGKELIGLQLFRNFTQEADGGWRGKVFVPDINGVFTGTARLVDANSLRARGCLIANVLCKAQVWTRVDGRAGLSAARD